MHINYNLSDPQEARASRCKTIFPSLTQNSASLHVLLHHLRSRRFLRIHHCFHQRQIQFSYCIQNDFSHQRSAAWTPCWRNFPLNVCQHTGLFNNQIKAKRKPYLEFSIRYILLSMTEVTVSRKATCHMSIFPRNIKRPVELWIFSAGHVCCLR